MKIPEAGNVGAYYGNEEGRQWQPNGLIIDNGVGGGVVGSGDAGAHRPPVYPVHLPRGPMPGYVMAGAYYPPAYPPVAAPPDDFADYMWMENEEEFDKQVMQQLEEEALMEQCIEAMLEDEQRERQRPVTNGHNHATTSNGTNSVAIQEAVSRSKLNPLAAEFVPNRARLPPEEKAEPPEAMSKEDTQKPQEDTQTDVPTHSEETSDVERKTEETEALEPQSEPPEVSAAHIQPIDTDKKKDKPKVKAEAKKPLKTELKPKVKSETKVKKDFKVKSDIQCNVKEVRSEVKCDVKCDDDVLVTDIVKQTTPPLTDETPSSGPKPINYAAAAKAMKPKKATTPPAIEKPNPPIRTEKSKERIEKKEKTPLNVKVKTEKPIQRKNSAK